MSLGWLARNMLNVDAQKSYEVADLLLEHTADILLLGLLCRQCLLVSANHTPGQHDFSESMSACFVIIEVLRRI